MSRKAGGARRKGGCAPRARRAASPMRRGKADAIDALVAAGAQALGLTLDPAWHAGVTFNLQLILRHAALVEGFPAA